MPELPDLQVFSANLDKKLAGKKVKQVAVPVTDKLNVSTATLKKALEGQKIKKVYRDGKELHIAFGNKNVLGLHLMLHGDLHIFEEKNKKKHTVLELYFDDKTGLALTDWQRAATPTLNPEAREAPDALSKAITYTFLKDALQTKSTIKNVLLDQHVIRGIGNAYADEILWKAQISPFSISNKIPDIYIKALVKAIKKVLTGAEKEIRKTHPDIISGEVRNFLPIHNAKKKESPTGGKIEHGKVNGRPTYYTQEQQLFK